MRQRWDLGPFSGSEPGLTVADRGSGPGSQISREENPSPGSKQQHTRAGPGQSPRLSAVTVDTSAVRKVHSRHTSPSLRPNMEAAVTIIITVMMAKTIALVRAESSRVVLSDAKSCLWHHLVGNLDKGVNFLVSHF